MMEGFKSTTLIPTPKGRVPIGELVPNKSYVFDRFGNKVLVKEIVRLGPQEMSAVEFADGQIAYCTDNCLWAYRGNNTRGTLTVRSLPQIAATPRATGYLLPEVSGNVNGFETYFPETESVFPYAMGVYAAKGGGVPRVNTSLILHTGNKEVVDKFLENTPFLAKRKINQPKDYLNYRWHFVSTEKKLLVTAKKGYEDSERIYFTIKKKNQEKENTRNFLEKDRACFPSNIRERSLPERYLSYHERDRLELLQGLMDVCGHVRVVGDGKKAETYFSHPSKKLVEQVGYLARSLGYRVRPRNNDAKKWEDYSIWITGTYSEKLRLFSIDSKCERLAIILENAGNGRKRKWLALKSITKLPGKRETYGIVVDNDSHLFLINDFIVAHDSTPIGG